MVMIPFMSHQPYLWGLLFANEIRPHDDSNDRDDLRSNGRHLFSVPYQGLPRYLAGLVWP